MTYGEKLKIYRKMLASLSKSVQLAALLREQGRPEEAERVARKSQQLAQETAKLRKGITAQWRGRAEEWLDEIRAENSKLQRRIRKVEQSLDTARDIVRALGYVDEIIGFARKILG
jgi:hypothetical protein